MLRRRRSANAGRPEITRSGSFSKMAYASAEAPDAAAARSTTLWARDCASTSRLVASSWTRGVWMCMASAPSGGVSVTMRTDSARMGENSTSRYRWRGLVRPGRVRTCPGVTVVLVWDTSQSTGTFNRRPTSDSSTGSSENSTTPWRGWTRSGRAGGEVGRSQIVIGGDPDPSLGRGVWRSPGGSTGWRSPGCTAASAAVKQAARSQKSPQFRVVQASTAAASTGRASCGRGVWVGAAVGRVVVGWVGIWDIHGLSTDGSGPRGDGRTR